MVRLRCRTGVVAPAWRAVRQTSRRTSSRAPVAQEALAERASSGVGRRTGTVLGIRRYRATLLHTDVCADVILPSSAPPHGLQADGAAPAALPARCVVSGPRWDRAQSGTADWPLAAWRRGLTRWRG